MLANLTDLKALDMQGVHVDLAPLAALTNLNYSVPCQRAFEGKNAPDYSIFADIYPNLKEKNFDLP